MLARCLTENKKLLAVVPSGQEASRLAGDLVFYLPELEPVILPEEEDMQILYEARDRSSLVMRIKAISALAGAVPTDADVSTGRGLVMVIAPVSSAVRPTASPDRFLSSVIRIKTGERTDPQKLRKRLADAGYTAAPVTESPGEFTSRGGILDVFAPSMNEALRIEFFDDEVDSIRTFDTGTQRSTGSMDEVSIVPAAEFMPDNEEKEKALSALMKEYDRMIRRYRKEHAHPDVKDGRIDMAESHRGRIRDLFGGRGGSPQIYADLIEYFDVEKYRLWDHVKGGITAVVDPARVTNSLPDRIRPEVLFAVYEGAYGQTASRSVEIYTPYPEAVPGLEKCDDIDGFKIYKSDSNDGISFSMVMKAGSDTYPIFNFKEKDIKKFLD